MTSTDPDILGSLPAMKRAARAARRLAEATGTPLYVMKNGRIVDLNAPRKRKAKARG
jgi:hypothetical protein